MPVNPRTGLRTLEQALQDFEQGPPIQREADPTAGSNASQPSIELTEDDFESWEANTARLLTP